MPSPEIIFFTAAWAPPAKAAAPIFSEILAELQLTGRLADVDLESELADRCGVTLVPAIAIVDEESVKLIEGSRPKSELRSWIVSRIGAPPPPGADH